MRTATDYHMVTAHHPTGPKRDDPRLVPNFVPMDPARRPPQCKRYEGLERMELPQDIDVHRLSRLLFLSAGVMRVARWDNETMLFRAAGSAGNLQPLETYVTWEGALFHYDAPGHALVRLRNLPFSTPPQLVITGVPWRTGWKYGERGFRHLYWDAGSMLANVLELEPQARVEAGFVDDELSALLGVDGTHEFPLAVVTLDGTTPALGAQPADASLAATGHLGEDLVEFPLITQAQRAGDLKSQEEVEAWRSDTAPPPRPTSWRLRGDLADIIRRRGSTRAFDPRAPAPRELLVDVMEWASRPLPCDFTSSTLLEHNFLVHGVEGVPAGAYRLPHPTALQAGNLRNAGAFLCLGQPLGGSGAFTVFHSAKVEELDDRRYRAALLEAGVVSGRLHLAAFSLGFGASGLTYFDSEVRSFFGTKAWPLLVTAVGAPTYRNRPGGLPRRPVTLRG